MKFKLIVPLTLILLALGMGRQAQARTLFFELSPVYFFFEGGGGSFGSERGHWQYGISFSTFNPDGFVQKGSVNILGAFTTLRTMNFEPFTKFYFSKERRRLYLGLNMNPQLNFMRDDSTQNITPILSIFANPKVGWRWFPFKRHFYIDGSYAMRVLVFKGEAATIGTSALTWEDFVGVPELSIGFRF